MRQRLILSFFTITTLKILNMHPQYILSKIPDWSNWVDEFGLIQVGGLKKHVPFTSRFECRPLFCDKYKRLLDERRQKREALCRELYKRNKKGSSYVHASYSVDKGK